MSGTVKFSFYLCFITEMITKHVDMFVHLMKMFELKLECVSINFYKHKLMPVALQNLHISSYNYVVSYHLKITFTGM